MTKPVWWNKYFEALQSLAVRFLGGEGKTDVQIARILSMSGSQDVQDVRDVAQAKLGDPMQCLRADFEVAVITINPNPLFLRVYPEDYSDEERRGKYRQIGVETLWEGYQLGHARGMSDSSQPMWIESSSQAAEQIKRDEN